LNAKKGTGYFLGRILAMAKITKSAVDGGSEYAEVLVRQKSSLSPFT